MRELLTLSTNEHLGYNEKKELLEMAFAIIKGVKDKRSFMVKSACLLVEAEASLKSRRP